MLRNQHTTTKDKKRRKSDRPQGKHPNFSAASRCSSCALSTSLSSSSWVERLYRSVKIVNKSTIFWQKSDIFGQKRGKNGGFDVTYSSIGKTASD
jgi:hypothetical protein